MHTDSVSDHTHLTRIHTPGCEMRPPCAEVLEDVARHAPAQRPEQTEQADGRQLVREGLRSMDHEGTDGTDYGRGEAPRHEDRVGAAQHS
jgi:hypothetical protein